GATAYRARAARRQGLLRGLAAHLQRPADPGILEEIVHLMGLLSLFSKPSAQLQPLPRGSFTVDSDGRILVSTLPQSFSRTMAADIATEVLSAFRASHAARLPLTELVIRYSSLKLTARELRGGAIIFLAPRNLSHRSS